MSKTEVKVSPLNDHILDIRFVYSFSKYQDFDEHLESVLEHGRDTPDMEMVKYEYQFRKQNGGVVEELQPTGKTMKELRMTLIEDWMKGQRRRV